MDWQLKDCNSLWMTWPCLCRLGSFCTWPLSPWWRSCRAKTLGRFSSTQQVAIIWYQCWFETLIFCSGMLVGAVLLLLIGLYEHNLILLFEPDPQPHQHWLTVIFHVPAFNIYSKDSILCISYKANTILLWSDGYIVLWNGCANCSSKKKRHSPFSWEKSRHSGH